MGEHHRGQKEASKRMNYVLGRQFGFVARDLGMKWSDFCSDRRRKFISHSTVAK